MEIIVQNVRSRYINDNLLKKSKRFKCDYTYYWRWIWI